jgi:UDP-N-acetylmuramate--alanine ligase
MNSPIPSSAHLAGIGGVGMSALAQILLHLGAEVSGSDRLLDRGTRTDTLARLAQLGVRLVPQDGSGIDERTVVFAHSTAIEPDNPDLLAARGAGLDIAHRAALLARLIGRAECIAVTGTSGKTTVTGMLGWILEQAGLRPTVVNGGDVLNWRTETWTGSARAGAAGLWLVEADESDRSLTAFCPAHTLITNASRDHFGLEETREIFREFADRTGRTVFAAPAVAEAIGGFPAGRGVHAHPAVREDGGRLWVGGRPVNLSLPGEHNRRNAWLASLAALDLGAPPETVRRALESFQGIRRRLQCVGEARGVRVIDDYAHNPAKIRAALRAVRQPRGRTLAVFRPHGYKPLQTMLEDLAAVFRNELRAADELRLLPVYYAGGAVERACESDDLLASLDGAPFRSEIVGDHAGLVDALSRAARPGDTILLMGARDPELPLSAARLAERLASG